MTIPALHPRAIAREPFSAFVCDDATADLLKPVATEMGWTHERIVGGGLARAVQTLSVASSPALLFIDLGDSADPMHDINLLADVCEPGTTVIAAGTMNDVRLYRDLIAGGIHDYLPKPFGIDQLRDAITRAQLATSGPRTIDAAPERPHFVTAVIGVRGGVGASSIATSIAWLLGEKAGRRTALLDLDVHFGTGALSLDLEPGRGLTDAIENPGRIDGLFIERAMVKANERLSVLSAEAPITQPSTGDGAAFYQLQDEMRAAFDCTVIDLPRAMLIQHPHLLNDVQAVVVVADFTLPAMRDTIRILSWLKTHAPQARPLLIANRVAPAGTGEIAQKDFEGSVEMKVDLVLPMDQKLAAQAAKLGRTLADAGRAGKIGAALALLAMRLIADGDGAEPAATGRSLLKRISGIRGRLPRRGAKT